MNLEVNFPWIFIISLVLLTGKTKPWKVLCSCSFANPADYLPSARPRPLHVCVREKNVGEI